MPDSKQEEITETSTPKTSEGAANEASERPTKVEAKPVEVGGRDGPDPVRYGDWEKGGRCIDF